jgi:hypothetical protein
MSADRPDPLAPPEGYGVEPGQAQEHPVAGHCQYHGGKCPHRVAFRYWIGDRAEHVWPLDLCWCCASQHDRIPMGNCTICKQPAKIIRREAIEPEPHRSDCEGSSDVQSALDRLRIKVQLGGPAGTDRFA